MPSGEDSLPSFGKAPPARSDSRLHLSILGGSGLIALAIFFGLRQPSPEQPSIGAPAMPSSEIHRSAQAALEARRAEMAALCLKGSEKPLRLVFSLAFDPQGNEVGRGISDDLTPDSTQVARCLRDRFLTTLRIPPPRAPVSTEVAIHLP